MKQEFVRGDDVVIPEQCVHSECGCCNLTTHERWTIGCNIEVKDGN